MAQAEEDVTLEDHPPTGCPAAPPAAPAGAIARARPDAPPPVEAGEAAKKPAGVAAEAAAFGGLAPPISLPCIFCHDALARGDAVYCASCLAPHHRECFGAHERCAAPGCGEALTVRPLRVERRRGAWRDRLGRSAVVLLAAVVGGAAALAAASDLRRDAASPPLAAEPAQARPACGDCGAPADLGVPAARLGDDDVRFCGADHRRGFLRARLQEQRAAPLQAPVLAVHVGGQADLGEGLLAGVLEGDVFGVWRGGRVVGRLHVREAEDARALAFVDAAAPGEAVRAGDVAVRANDPGLWARVEREWRRERSLARAADRVARVRVLYVDGQPTAAYRRRQRLLTGRTRAQAFLASAEAGHVHAASPGLAPLTAAPEAPGGWDVVVLGEGVPSRLVERLDLGAFVRAGGGLVLVPGGAGARGLAPPARDLSPVAHRFGPTPAPPAAQGRGAVDRRLPLTRALVGDAPVPALALLADPGRLRPGAEVLLEDGRGLPVVVGWTIGRGRAASLADEEARRLEPDPLHEALWLDLLAWAAGRE
ncbi:MAG: hypothetical protein M9894_06725 [Planctomycetes bacterium]|nr:hypothetical protein [Planctomycetota bacterium]